LNHLPAVEGMLDIFDAVEQVAETARTVFGEGTAEAKQWLDAGRTMLLDLRKAARSEVARSMVPARI
jgi:hypothetical protein